MAGLVLMSHRIAVLTAHDHRMLEMGAMSIYDKSIYCQRHNYSLEVITDGFDKSRPAAWSKLRFIEEVLPAYDWVLWADTDLLLMNKDIRLQDYVDDRYDIVAGIFWMNTASERPEDWYTIHTGCFLIRNTAWSLDFLRMWWSQTQYVGVHLQEERALNYLHKTIKGVQGRVKTVPLRAFCSLAVHPVIIGTKLQECIYRLGDFVMHFLEMPRNEKLPYMRAAFSRLYPGVMPSSKEA